MRGARGGVGARRHFIAHKSAPPVLHAGRKPAINVLVKYLWATVARALEFGHTGKI